mgnify:FL=1|jgi:hypothetical protein
MTTSTCRSHYKWNPADSRIYPGGAALVAVAQDGTEIVLYLDDFDGEVRPAFGLHFPDTREWATTDDCRTWGRVEQYIPRVELPADIDAGKRGPTRDERTPDQAVQEAIDEYRRTLEEALAEADFYETQLRDDSAE